MTHKNVDRLFLKYKEKEDLILIKEEAITGIKDFARSVKFFAINLYGDQLLNGLPPIG